MDLSLFTLDQARALLPRVRALMDQAQAARRSIIEQEPELWPVLAKAVGNGHSAKAGQVVEHYDALRRAVRAILELGVQLKDLEMGLVDFLSIHKGREVFLCWRQGEDDIRFWHDLDSGFAGRRPIED